MNRLAFAQKAFIVLGDSLLLVRKSLDDPYNPGLWEVPGGRLELGEDTDYHIIREVKEEVGIEVRPGRPFFLWQWQLPVREPDGVETRLQVVAVARRCEPVSLELSNENRAADDYLGDAEWVPFSKLLSYELIPNMRPVVRAFLDELAYEAQDREPRSQGEGGRQGLGTAEMEEIPRPCPLRSDFVGTASAGSA